MKKCVYFIVVVVSGVLVVFGCIINFYIGECEVGKFVIGVGLGFFVGVGIGVLFFLKKDCGKGVLIGVVVGVVLGGGVGYYMDVQEAKLCDKMCGIGVSVICSGDNIIFNMLNNVIFDSSSVILKLVGVNILIGVVMVLKEYLKMVVNVIGYIDSMGGYDLNMCFFQ